MTDRPATPTFRAAAVASGLLTKEQLREAEDAARNDGESADVTPKVAEGRLIAKLVEFGRLNAWQVEQLKLGRTKFTLGPYLVIDSIGQGGMGQVFKAVHTLMGRVVAIKVLPRHKATPAAINSFSREIRAQAQLDHENLVRAFDAGHDGNVHFLVTEYVPGTDLRKFVRARTRLTMAESATIISQAAKGIEYAHSRGMVHRDIKPGNLLVTPDGHTKVSDLGLAGFLGETDLDDPRAGKVVGTADYLSPEQIQNPTGITPAVDVYSLGCTLYYAVTGKVPFPGGTTKEKALRHCEDTPINPRRLNTDLSDEFAEVLADMMQKDPAKRISTMTEVVERLAPWAREAVANAVSDSEMGISPPLLAAGVPSEMGDTDSGFLYGEPGEESVSQISQGTDPLAAMNQETLPFSSRHSHEARHPMAQVPWQVAAAVLGPLVVASLALFFGMLLTAFH